MSKLKIIGKSNFDSETVSDVLVASQVQNDLVGKIMVDALNAKAGSYAMYFYMLVPDEYELYVWEP